jgi:Na+/melibiose symporter-like transporter
MNSKLQKKKILYYSLIALPLAIIGLPLYIYIPTFYTNDIGLDIAIVGLLIFIARLSDVFTDPFFGYLSDKCIQWFNSRKPLMILGSVILIYSFYNLINPNEEFPKTWLLIYSILIYIAWSMINIPYLTWSSEISFNKIDTTTLNTSREMFTIIGVIIALLIPYIHDVAQKPKETLELLLYSFLILFIPFFVISMQNISIKSKSTNNNFNLTKIKEIYTDVSDLKYLQIGYFFNNLANALPATLFLLFIEFVIQEKDSSGIILVLYFCSAVIALPFWNLLANKIGKKNTWLISIVLASLAFIFVPFLEAKDLTPFIIISIITGLSLGADMALPTSIQSDVVQKINTKNENISGLLFGIWTMITKLSLALSVAFSFLILGLFNFETKSPSEESLLVLTALYSLVPIFFKLLAIYFIRKYSHNR